ncbi:nucleoside 2-deoxyribosyltransferase [Rhizobium tubonense]|uniref:Nucleoside 2-deoxyribosyltransferase n=1 Tax=Rhizobium tubonense TaxID=484088 RepID=A0A2W4CHP7_9HYPH|nr:nucleoside 2-deoxyribosyltransferase [Rhizobium tubonense]PZM10165.1 nucleoside 2-deoxyribosyltransferase [Rhizobium tubonense]
MRIGISLTFDGYSHLEQLKANPRASLQAFVAMWFGIEVAEAYKNGIGPAIIDAGYRPMRIDQKEHNNKIDDEIIAEIRRSRFVVADFTCGLVFSERTQTAIPRGGVYYEAGFAQGLGIPVIWTCREDHIEHVHFDTRQFNHITWKTPEELREKLKNRIGAVIGDGPQ